MISSSTNQVSVAQQQQHQQHLQQHQQPPQRGHNVQTRDYASLQLEVFELSFLSPKLFYGQRKLDYSTQISLQKRETIGKEENFSNRQLCIFQRVKRIQSKDTTQCGQLVQDNTMNDEQRSEHINRSMYRILNEVEAKIVCLPNNTDPITPDYFDEWSFLTWALLQIINRLEAMSTHESSLLDYGGKHFKEKIHTALVDLVNKAHRMQPPPTLQPNDQQFERFYQSYVTALISLHELYTMTQQHQHQQQNTARIFEFEAHIAHFKTQLNACFALQRSFANSHGSMIWRQLREHQIRKMTHYGYENRGFLDSAVTFYAHMLYNLGGFSYEIRNNKTFVSGHSDLVKPLLTIVYKMADVLLSDSIICLEPSLNPILVTNNLFQMKIVSLCRFSFFRDFSLQIVSEEVAQQIQQEMLHHKTFDPPSPIRKTRTAALLAMKPATGGGNTAHKKSDVNSKEWISIPPLYDTEHGGWCATYPHLLCTTRQKDCQVQRMMSSYTATCFWLYGTNVLDGLLLQWNDGEIDWKHFKLLYSLYFAMNSEVTRTFTDEDFTILQQKMHCSECTDASQSNEYSSLDQFPHNQRQQFMPDSRISFKNVLCPHLHFTSPSCDLRFSVWRGMLELLHLFSDQKMETRNLWEAGLLQGFMELNTVVFL
uniref:Protein SMG7 n=1 Tax=Meloidogyne hapla TaxID=6305 RepID=A0A1I8B186_MELHA